MPSVSIINNYAQRGISFGNDVKKNIFGEM